jgi:hypothetical protein
VETAKEGYMPRRRVVHSLDIYRGYGIKDKYSYDASQLDTIINALNFYTEESSTDKGSNYVVFDITIKVKDSPISPYFDPLAFDDGYQDQFDVNNLKTILPESQYFYRWTREWSDKNQEHYHLMVVANHPAKTGFIETLQTDIKSLIGVKSVFISPRLLDEGDHRRMIHFHWLNSDVQGRDGLVDAINRHSYRAKLDQKIDGVKRTFDGSRKLKPLQPLSTYLESRQINKLSKVA